MKKQQKTRSQVLKKQQPRKAQQRSTAHSIRQTPKVEIGLRAIPEVDFNGSRARGAVNADNTFSSFIREPGRWSQVGDEFRVVAVDRSKYSGAKHAVLPEILQLHWNGKLDTIAYPDPELLNLTSEMWESVGLDFNPAWTAQLLNLRPADTKTLEAFHAALYLTFNASEDYCDLSTAAFAVAAFIAATAAEEKLLDRTTLQMPFGKNRTWALLKR